MRMGWWTRPFGPNTSFTMTADRCVRLRQYGFIATGEFGHDRWPLGASPNVHSVTRLPDRRRRVGAKNPGYAQSHLSIWYVNYLRSTKNAVHSGSAALFRMVATRTLRPCRQFRVTSEESLPKHLDLIRQPLGFFAAGTPVVILLVPADHAAASARQLRVGQPFAEIGELRHATDYYQNVRGDKGDLSFWADGEQWFVIIADGKISRIEHSPDNGPFWERSRRSIERSFRALKRLFRLALDRVCPPSPVQGCPSGPLPFCGGGREKNARPLN
jgi:hypothetical protein